MFNIFVALLSASVLCFCHGLPASVSEAHSSASQKLHLYIKNSTEGVNYQLSPIISQLRNTNEEVEFGRNAILPFLSFLFDTLGDIENELSDCLDDMVIQLIPDDPSDPGFPNIPTEPSVPIGPIVPADIAASENKPK
ncbi:unnamed protein product, partial [Iphiclides podalirius]